MGTRMGKGGSSGDYERTARSLLQRASHWDLFLLGHHANPGPTTVLLLLLLLPLQWYATLLLLWPRSGLMSARLTACRILTAEERRSLLAGELNTSLRHCLPSASAPLAAHT
ncbi:hypothetical protein KM043_014534 [Ampulex compressa]|nr:hypothetical protein KM043_014534 [Ampulex compressa]